MTSLLLRLLVSTSFLLSGCSGILFFPTQTDAMTPKRLGLAYRNVYLRTTDQKKIHGWLLTTPNPKGTVLYLHDNTGNIGTHIANVQWLPATGYQVFLLDYRGFGASQGSPELPDLFEDITAAEAWLAKAPETAEHPLYLLGQSLGASLGLCYVARGATAKARFSGLVSDAAFTRYSDMARRVTSQVWLTSLFQHPISWAIVDSYDALDCISETTPMPLLMFHSSEDEVVPLAQGRALAAARGDQPRLVVTDDAHTDTFTSATNRRILLDFLAAHRAPTGVVERP